MAGKLGIAACALALGLSGCGDDTRAPVSYKGEFSPHGSQQFPAGVSAGVGRASALPDATAARRIRRTRRELRSQNADENRRVPTARELGAFRSAAKVSAPELVTGRFKGTTDEILQWAAAKWSIKPDIVRAVAYVESRWRMSEKGDNGLSLGLMQIKSTVHTGTKPLSELSSAFNVDFWGAVIRDYYDGRHTWLMDVPHGRSYKAGDIWGALGAWYSGRWYTPEAVRYIAEVKGVLAAKPWKKRGFAE